MPADADDTGTLRPAEGHALVDGGVGRPTSLQVYAAAQRAGSGRMVIDVPSRDCVEPYGARTAGFSVGCQDRSRPGHPSPTGRSPRRGPSTCASWSSTNLTNCFLRSAFLNEACHRDDQQRPIEGA
jgi:hypothetical protein